MALNNGGFMCVFLVDNFCCYELHVKTHAAVKYRLERFALDASMCRSVPVYSTSPVVTHQEIWFRIGYGGEGGGSHREQH